MRTIAGAVMAGAALLLAVMPAEAASKSRKQSVQVDAGGAHPASSYYRRGPQVRGYVARRGGYSFSIGDTINTFGDSRSAIGSSTVYREPWSNRQTIGGPFDHGFFFDSGIGPRGGDSPYMN